jgi:hypothetical protein
MKPHKNILMLIVVMLLCNVAFSQRSNWTLGFSMGYKIQMLEKTPSPSDLKIKSFVGDVGESRYGYDYPSIRLNLIYNINERFSIGSGIGFFSYCAFWKMEQINGWEAKYYAFSGDIMLKYLQIPLNIKYAMPLWKKISVYGKLGLNLDILADVLDDYDHNYNGLLLHKETDGGRTLYEFKQTAAIHDKKINVLLNAGIGLEYRFKNGWGLFAEGEYYAGLRTIGHVDISVKELPDGIPFPYVQNEYKELLLIKGNYWNFNLGVSYNFKQKKKT